MRACPALSAAALAPCRCRAGTRPASQAPMTAAASAAVFARPQRPWNLPGPCCEAVRRGRRASRIETVGEGVVGRCVLGQSDEVQRRQAVMYGAAEPSQFVTPLTPWGYRRRLLLPRCLESITETTRRTFILQTQFPFPPLSVCAWPLSCIASPPHPGLLSRGRCSAEAA